MDQIKIYKKPRASPALKRGFPVRQVRGRLETRAELGELSQAVAQLEYLEECRDGAHTPRDGADTPRLLQFRNRELSHDRVQSLNYLRVSQGLIKKVISSRATLPISPAV